MQPTLNDIQAASQAQNWQQCVDLCQQFLEHDQSKWEVYWRLGLAYQYLDQYAAAERAFQILIKYFPQRVQYGYEGMIGLANHQAKWLQSLEWCEQAIALFPNHLSFYQHKGLALIHLQQFDEAEAYFLALAQQFPNEYMPLYGLTRVYYPQRKRDKVIHILQEALLKFPNRQDVAAHLIDAYIQYNEPEKAQNIFDNYLQDKENVYNQFKQAEIEKLAYGNTHYRQKLRQLRQQFPDNVHLMTIYTQHIIHFRLSHYAEETPEYALQLFETFYRQHPQYAWLKNLLTYHYIKLGKHDLALQLIQQLPTNKQTRENLKFWAWQAHQQQDFDLEKQYWQRLIQQDFYPELADKSHELRQIYPQPIQLQATDFPLFTVAYNELLRIPDFLRHYRQLGVTHFFFVDNHSTDGSLEFLLQQPDCYVFSTSHSHNESGSGMAWVNDLVHRYAQSGQWCLYTDVDELLIYPHCETRSLQDLTEYLNQQGAEVMSSYMLDMYPPNLVAQLAFQAGDNMLAKSPYFYNQYDFNHKIECPYISPAGGIFHYFDAPSLFLVKTGVFKYTEDFYFLCSSHHITPKKVADISSTYLHFKMLGDFQAKAQQESQRKQHAESGAIYRKYAQMYENALDEHLDLSTLDKSVKYQNSQQLVELGLIQTSAAWEDYVQAHSQ